MQTKSTLAELRNEFLTAAIMMAVIFIGAMIATWVI